MTSIASFRSDLHREIAQLRERNEALERQVEWLRELFMPVLPFPERWRLTPAETALLAALYASKNFHTREAAHHAACGDEAETDLKIVDIHVCKLRRKLTAIAGNPVETIRGLGFRLSPHARAAIAAALPQADPPQLRRAAS